MNGAGQARFLLIIASILLIAFSVARAEEQTLAVAGMNVTVWSEPTGGETKKPVIVFSHGFHGWATQSRFLMEALASAGYLVVAPNHQDATFHGGQASWIDRPEVPFRKPEGWSDSTFRDRGDDLRRLIGALRLDTRFRVADWSRLGLVGHSLGGYTVLGVAGAWPRWKLPGIKAVLALSPYTHPYAVHHTLSGVYPPVMYQSGSWDFFISPVLTRPSGTYDQTAVSKYYVEFARAGHFAWTDIHAIHHKNIISYSLAFMDHYVRGKPADPILSHAASGVSVLRYRSELGDSETTVQATVQNR